MKSRHGQTQKSYGPITIQTLDFWQTMDSATPSFTAWSYAFPAGRKTTTGARNLEFARPGNVGKGQDNDSVEWNLPGEDNQ